MANKTLFGLAFLNYNWDTNKKDIIDTYIPLVCECIISKQANVIDRDILQQNLIEEYGLNVTLGAIESILKRCQTEKYLIRDKGVYKVDWSVLSKHTRNLKSRNLVENSFEDVLSNIVIFAKKEFDITYLNQEVETGFVTFLKKYDADIVLANDDKDIEFQGVRDKNKLQYIISKYIMYANKEKKFDFTKIVNIAQGHAIATIVSNTNIQTYVGLLNNVIVFLDAPMIFNLMGINGESNLSLSKELIESLIDKGARIQVFSVNDEEVTSTISDAIERLKTGNYIIEKSSRVLKTAIRESYSSSKLQLKLNQLNDLYAKFKIEIVDNPEINTKYQINEEKLVETIKEIYSKGGTRYIGWQQKNQIERDAKTIANIYQIRGATNILSLKQCKALLITTNEAIAFSSRNYQISNFGNNAKIAPCVTDIFIATILWANYPSKNNDLNIKKLLSICYSNTELDNKLFQKFYNDVEVMHKEQRISEEQFYLLNTSNLTYKLLEKKTLNDIEEYTDKTASEIVEDLINSYKRDGNIINKNVRIFSNYCGKVAFWLIWILLLAFVLFIRILLPEISDKLSSFWIWTITIIAAFVGGFGLFRWAGLIPDKSLIVSYISLKVEKIVMKILRKE